ncbi:UFO kinase, partial [Polypterus senegalus]
MTVHLGGHRAVVLVGYEAVQEALMQHADVFSGRAQFPLLVRLLRGFGLVLSNGERWKQLRRFTLTTLRDFGMGKRSIEEWIQEEARHLTEEFRKNTSSPCDPTFFLSRAVSNVICSIVFGQRFEYQDKRFVHLLKLINENIRLISSPSGQLYNLFPSMMNILPGTYNMLRKNVTEIDEFVTEMIKGHKETLSDDDPRDYIDAFLIKMKQENGSPATEFHQDNLQATVLNLFLAGTETTSTTLRYGLLILMKYPHIQEKIHQEIDAVIGRDHTPAMEHRKKMPFTDAVVHEIQRFIDIAPMNVPHMTTRNTSFRGYSIPAGTLVIPLLHSVLFDKTQWESPQSFNPGHFLDKDGCFKMNPAFMPFSTDDKFQQLQRNFMENYYLEFEESEENNLNYPALFKEYKEQLGKYIEEQLVARMPGFSMESFTGSLDLIMLEHFVKGKLQKSTLFKNKKGAKVVLESDATDETFLSPKRPIHMNVSEKCIYYLDPYQAPYSLPHFTEEPQNFDVVANQAFNLTCHAQGPPDPVRVIWLQNDAPLNLLQDDMALSPSTLSVQVLPDKPQNLHLSSKKTDSLDISWTPGFGGDYEVTVCTVQATSFMEDNHSVIPSHLIYNQNVRVPLESHTIPGLEPFTVYQVRVACLTSEGMSQWTDWAVMVTEEGVPDSPPANVTTQVNGTIAVVWWSQPAGPVNGILRGYRVAYQGDNFSEEVLDVGLTNETTVNLTLSFANFSVRVSAYTGAGDGPWSEAVILILNEPNARHFSWHWWYVVVAISGAIACAILVAVYIARLRRKETRFGEAFEPMMERGELVVRYRAQRSYCRRTMEATLNSLGISDDLKEKLQDVMVDRHKLALGKTLGEGEFGSVMAGQLTQEDYILKVAVKTMKSVCLQNVESEGYPSPVVILPFMKHGDLHSYLLYSRLGDSPHYLPVQMLVKFMTDIARGMEYLSNKNFIHRDLAARNCMLNENMTVCVADFGLSKKIYNGDYYRQGRISKMPVKWIAIESLADRVYTTKSDVWSFGVTMWEIATRGQTPYPGVENSEIYDYLRQGNRLKQPPDCLDGIYTLMFSCWLLSPKERPGFEHLRCELEKIQEDLPDFQDPEEILYVNMEEPGSQSRNDAGELGAVGGSEPPDSLKHLPCSFLSAPAKGGTTVTADIHPPGRYVLCPRHETTRLLSESLESLNQTENASQLDGEGPALSSTVHDVLYKPPHEQ